MSAPIVNKNTITSEYITPALKALGVRASLIPVVAEALAKECTAYQCNTPRRIAGLLGQLALESNKFAVTSENLYYTTLSVLTRVFRSRVEPNPAQYLRNPRKLANKVYSTRKELGNLGGEDGWNYRGSGWIQTTGRYNFTMLSKAIGIDLVNYPSYLRDKHDIMAKAALYYYMDQKKCYIEADAKNWDGVTRKVNTGMLEASVRAQYSNIALKALGGK